MCKLLESPNGCELGLVASNKAMLGGAVAASLSNSAAHIGWVAEHATEIPLYCAMISAAVAVLGLISSQVFNYYRLKLDRRTAENAERRHKQDRRRQR